MNIIKFKDTIVEGEDWYNETLRGKYAYWVRCRYVVPLESINQNMYVSFETTINNLLAYDYYKLVAEDEALAYAFVSLANVTPAQREAAVLVPEIPVDPTVESPSWVKLDHSVIRYVDLWQGDYYWMNSYIDQTETDIVNSVDTLKQYNNYVPEGELTLDDLKRFRTWLATSLLDLNYSFYEYKIDAYVPLANPSLDERLSAKEVVELPLEDEGVVKIKNLDVVDWTDDNVHVLEYYRGGMTDDTLKWLGVYGGVQTAYNTTIPQNSCGCGSGTNVSSLYGDSVSVCDTQSIYRNGLKLGMVALFTDLDMWLGLPKSYVGLVKQYIDGIIQANLGLSVDDKNNYYGCECLNKSGQDNGMTILKQLSTSLGYLSDPNPDPARGHKNFIVSSLTQWANELYELMEWK